MSGIDLLLDRTDPIADGEESWSDRSWGTIYCMECGDESTRVEKGRFVSIHECRNEECDVGSDPTLRHPIAWAVSLIAIVTAAISTAGFAFDLSLIVGLLVALAFWMGGWYLFYDPAAVLEEVDPR